MRIAFIVANESGQLTFVNTKVRGVSALSFDENATWAEMVKRWPHLAAYRKIGVLDFSETLGFHWLKQADRVRSSLRKGKSIWAILEMWRTQTEPTIHTGGTIIERISTFFGSTR